METIKEYTSKKYENLEIRVDGRLITFRNPLGFSMEEDTTIAELTNIGLISRHMFELIVAEPEDRKFLRELNDRVVIERLMDGWKIWADGQRELEGLDTTYSKAVETVELGKKKA